jgi:hypothetical protein
MRKYQPMALQGSEICSDFSMTELTLSLTHPPLFGTVPSSDSMVFIDLHSLYLGSTPAQWLLLITTAPFLSLIAAMDGLALRELTIYCVFPPFFFFFFSKTKHQQPLSCAAAFIWHDGLYLHLGLCLTQRPLPGQQPLSGTTAFLWHNGLSLAQRPFSGTTAFLWLKSLCLVQPPLPRPRLLLDPIGTVAFIWRNGLHLAQRPSSGASAFIWRNGLHLAQQPLSDATTFIWCNSLFLAQKPL